MHQYTGLVKKVLHHGSPKNDRTKVGTFSLFGEEMDINLNDGFPLMTHKFVSFKIAAAELIWFMSGCTNIRPLQKLGVKIWDEWADEDGDLGPVYGAQWRGRGKSRDQLAHVIYDIIHNPDSRRLLVDSFDPEVLPLENTEPKANPKHIQHLPPCHYAFQFYVRWGKYLSIKFNMRSSDVILGLPYNVASYSLLVHIVCAMTGLEPDRTIASLGDTHIYKNHIETGNVDEILTRDLYILPRLDITDVIKPLEDTSIPGIIKYLDTTFNLDTNPELVNQLQGCLVNYNHGGKLKFPVAV